MGTEIERKFLLRDDRWRTAVRVSEDIVQGYLANTERGSIRVRLAGDSASLNLKSMTLGVTRSEFDYPIPADDARAILKFLCMQPLIEKTRHHVPHAGHDWEIDEFRGENLGLIVAELELQHPDQPFTPPSWLGREVSDDPRYYNVCLVEQPYRNWAPQEESGGQG
ncbi:MAG: CYTH domain-containing protein [Gammaproteobacteria bacterium]|nr:CYTH domain-containing protein [Gammaproteobacteria bacterium]